MSEQDNQNKDAQKTVVAFIAGLLIGGLLVWVFATPSEDNASKDTNDDSGLEDMMDDEDVDTSNDTGGVTFTTKNDTVSDTLVAEKPVMTTGTGSISVKDQAAGKVVDLASVTFPSDEGWIGVRDYQNGQLTGLLGVARWSNEQGLIPSEVELLRSTVAGEQYAVVFYSESGDREFSLADDVQMEGVVSTFTAK